MIFQRLWTTIQKFALKLSNKESSCEEIKEKISAPAYWREQCIWCKAPIPRVNFREKPSSREELHSKYVYRCPHVSIVFTHNDLFEMLSFRLQKEPNGLILSYNDNNFSSIEIPNYVEFCLNEDWNWKIHYVDPIFPDQKTLPYFFKLYNILEESSIFL